MKIIDANNVDVLHTFSEENSNNDKIGPRRFWIRVIVEWRENFRSSHASPRILFGAI